MFKQHFTAFQFDTKVSAFSLPYYRQYRVCGVLSYAKRYSYFIKCVNTVLAFSGFSFIFCHLYSERAQILFLQGSFACISNCYLYFSFLSFILLSFTFIYTLVLVLTSDSVLVLLRRHIGPSC